MNTADTASQNAPPSQDAPPVCAGHPHIEATHQCQGCLRHLCRQCLSQARHIFFCRFCGGHATRLVSGLNEKVTASEVISAGAQAFKGVGVHIVNHIILPITIIVMVTAFLFFLLDVRSVFLEGSPGLKKIGFFFAVATVLTARYGTIYAIRSRQNLYTLALSAATFLAMNKHSGGPANLFINVVVIAVIWRFSTSLTNSLNIDEDDEIKDPHERKMYGLERIKHEEMEEKLGLDSNRYKRKKPGELDKSKDKSKSKKKKNWFTAGSDALGNPSKSVARLAAMAVILFALGEPFILSGPPDVGQRALMAVIVFLLCTGIVLACGSGVGTYRHTVKLGGKATLGMIPMKMFTGFLLMLTILAAGLMVPGLRYEGSGSIQPKGIYGKGGSGKGEEGQKKDGGSQGKQGQKDQQTQQQQARNKKEMDEATGKNVKQRQSRQSSGQGGGQSATEKAFGIFSQIGKLLLIPLAIGLIVLIIYILVKLWPALKGWRSGMSERWRKFLEKLRALFALRRTKTSGDVQPVRDPLAALSTIHTLPPKDAILTAYSCFLAFIERQGYERLPRLTPYEYLYSLPDRLSYLDKPARQLTEIYVSAAYSTKAPTPEQSRQALQELSNLQGLIQNREA